MHALILVIDDEDLIRSVCRSALERNGFRVLCAEDGERGVAAYRDNAAAIQLVLCDLSMPKFGGPELVRRIWSLNPWARIVLMSGYDVEALVPEDLRKTCILLSKPFTSERLIQAVEKGLLRQCCSAGK